MKTRKKMLGLSMIFVVIFTVACFYLAIKGYAISDELINDFFTFCIWTVAGSGVCGVTDKFVNRKTINFKNDVLDDIIKNDMEVIDDELVD